MEQCIREVKASGATRDNRAHYPLYPFRESEAPVHALFTAKSEEGCEINSKITDSSAPGTVRRHAHLLLLSRVKKKRKSGDGGGRNVVRALAEKDRGGRTLHRGCVNPWTRVRNETEARARIVRT